MSDREATPIISYAQGEFESPPRSPRILELVDMAFGIMVLAYNTILLLVTLYEEPHTVPNLIAIVEFSLSLLLIVTLLACASRLGTRGHRWAIRFHRWYARVKLVMALLFALLIAWINIAKGQADEAVAFGFLGFGVSAVHPLLIMVMLRQKARRE